MHSAEPMGERTGWGRVLHEYAVQIRTWYCGVS